MGQITVKAAAILDARADDVYATIADYRHGHPKILPKGRLYGLQVEEGGYGAGTMIRFKAKALGVEQAFYQCVSEPEPGRVLVEQDVNSPRDVITTFTVTPVEEERKAHVEIATTMSTSPGVQGWVERLLVPLLQRSVYREELHLLEAVTQKRDGQRE
jgi:hypothetical protein